MERQKARAIFTNDAECDDMNSLKHLLMYANDIDIEGIVLSSSVFHYAGDPEAGIEPKRWAGGDWMFEDLDAYEKILPNLRAHDPAYPSADELRAVTKTGNVKVLNDYSEDTEGSELVRAAILAENPRPVWLLAGGGTSTIAAALRSIEEDFKGTPEWDEVYRRVCRQARIFMIVTQDETYREYISQAWPDLPLLHCTELAGLGFWFNDELNPPDSLPLMSGDWLKPNLLDKGPLMARYNTWGDGKVYPGEENRSQFGSNPELIGGAWWGKVPHERYDMISEGDSASFVHLIDVGLRSLEDPTWGGWGGRFMPDPENEFNPDAAYWRNAADEAGSDAVKPTAYQFSRWMGDWMQEFAGRCDWATCGDYEQCNHRPSVDVAEGLDLTVEPGEAVRLTALPSDPDGDALSVRWFDYPEAGTLGRSVAVEQDGNACVVTVPGDAAAGQTVHLVCRVSDDVSHENGYMTTYARVILTVA